ncbi:MAG: GNAT family N-acetyltransferase [Planctomycetota bacterium]|nr:GNAT family N-acetyltransferase [Planctomycetota bacterium]
MNALPVVPAVVGLKFRQFRGESDLPLLTRVIDACRDEDGLVRVFSPEDLAQQVARQANIDPLEDYVVAEVEGAVVAWGSADYRQEVDGAWVFYLSAWVVPAWRRRGIGRAILRWQEERMRERATRIQDTGPRFLQGWAWESQSAKNELLVSEGYSPFSFYAYMVRPTLEDIPDTSLPDGIEVRPVRPEHYRTIFESENEAFRDHPGHSEGTENDFDAFTKEPTFDPSLWRVAWDGDEVAGMVRSFIREPENAEFGRKRGYAESISVRRPWRRKGVARALLGMSLHALQERGMEEAALEVSLANPNEALTLYESVGFEVTKKITSYRKPLARRRIDAERT